MDIGILRLNNTNNIINHYQKIELLKQGHNYQSKSSCIKKYIIPTSPELIFDAPEMTNNYYLNLLDWSNKNMDWIKVFVLWNAGTRR